LTSGGLFTNTRPELKVNSLQPRLVAHLDVAAASGIAVRGDALYVLADDELELRVYDRTGTRRSIHVLLEGTLPEQEAARKAAKPDFEALLSLPGDNLLALGSGSTSLRQRAVWLDLHSPSARPRSIDLGPLYARLRGELPELNIEGAALLDDRLLLGSRGNGQRHEDALIELDWPSFVDAVHRTGRAPAESFRCIHAIQLGEVAAQPLSLTDLTTADGRLFFSAAAEASPNTYDDGVCVGSAIGILSRTGQVEDCVQVISPVLKIEGLWATPSCGAYELLLVADPDDRAARAPLLAATYRPPEGRRTLIGT
jgi:hypothetical protein